MRVSAIIPAYQAQRYVAAAVASVLAEGVDEVLVVDDGSTDDTAEVVRGLPGVRLVQSPHLGIGAARNRGIAEAAGDVLTFVDADDLWVAGRLRIQLEALGKHPDSVILGELEEFVCPAVVRDQPDVASRLLPKAGRLMGWVTGAMVLTRATFDRVGPFPIDLEVGETIAWLATAKAMGVEFIELPQLVLLRRLHGDNTTLVAERKRSDYVALAKRLLDEKRRRTP
jgi:glycosyltransferase involved in cell wall biosynthesis